MMRTLFEQVRVQGRIELKQELSIRDALPVIYEGEADANSTAAMPYHNSGGRALIFERGKTIYRVKGVDPYAHLTQRVAGSKQNRLKNVRDAHAIAQSQCSDTASQRERVFDEGKPFGSFFLHQAVAEIGAFKKIAEAYAHLHIENPCEAVCYKNTGITLREIPLYQTVFRLPRLEADLRVHEFDSLLTERLDQCTPSEIAAKSKAIGRLYGRFIYWAGLNAGILIYTGLLPSQNSFHPQNWVISKYADGYGILRVDHTSTEQVTQEEALVNLTSKKDGVPYIINEFSILPSRVQVAANPAAFIQHYTKNIKFSEILHAQEGINTDESRVLEAHATVFQMGLSSTINKNPIASIPVELFEEALA